MIVLTLDIEIKRWRLKILHTRVQLMKIFIAFWKLKNNWFYIAFYNITSLCWYGQAMEQLVEPTMSQGVCNDEFAPPPFYLDILFGIILYWKIEVLVSKVFFCYYSCLLYSEWATNYITTRQYFFRPHLFLFGIVYNLF